MRIAKKYLPKSDNLNDRFISSCGNVTITVNGEEIKIFAPLITVQNPKAADIINNNKEIDNQVTAVGFKELIDYFGYSEIDINDGNVADIVVTSWYFEELDLLENSKQYYLDHQSPITLLRLLNSENIKFISSFQSVLNNYSFNQIITNNIIIMLNNENIREMKLSTFITILEQDNIVIPNEDYLADRILLFISYHQEVLPKVTELLLNYVDWKKASINFDSFVKKNQIDIDSNQLVKITKQFKHQLLNYPIDINHSDECIIVLDDVKRRYMDYQYHNVTKYEEEVLLSIPLESMLLCDNEDCNRLGLFIHIKNPKDVHEFFENKKNKKRIDSFVMMIENMHKESNFKIDWLRKYILYFLSIGLKLKDKKKYENMFKWMEIKDKKEVKISIKLTETIFKMFCKDMSNLCLIKELNNFTIDNSINAESKEFINICKSLHSINKLDKLVIKNNPINASDLEEMSNYFCNSLSFLTLSGINNSHNPLSQSKYFFSEKVFLKDLKCLNLGNNSLGSEGLSIFSRCLTKMPNLEQLTLNENGIDGTTVYSLASNLSSVTNLQKLSLSYNKIDKMGCSFIIKNLQYVTKLKELSLDNNDIVFESVLLNDFYQFTNIKILNLKYNTVNKELQTMKIPEGMNVFFTEAHTKTQTIVSSGRSSGISSKISSQISGDSIKTENSDVNYRSGNNNLVEIEEVNDDDDNNNNNEKKQDSISTNDNKIDLSDCCNMNDFDGMEIDLTDINVDEDQFKEDSEKSDEMKIMKSPQSNTPSPPSNSQPQFIKFPSVESVECDRPDDNISNTTAEISSSTTTIVIPFKENESIKLSMKEDEKNNDMKRPNNPPPTTPTHSRTPSPNSSDSDDNDGKPSPDISNGSNSPSPPSTIVSPIKKSDLSSKEKLEKNEDENDGTSQLVKKPKPESSHTPPSSSPSNSQPPASPNHPEPDISGGSTSPHPHPNIVSPNNNNPLYKRPEYSSSKPPSPTLSPDNDNL